MSPLPVDLLLLGWMLVRPTPKGDWQSPLVPDTILSLCDCLCETHPTWDEGWPEKNLPDTPKQSLAQYIYDNSISYGSLYFFTSVEAAQEINARAYAHALKAVGVALPLPSAKALNLYINEQMTRSNPQLPAHDEPFTALPWSGHEALLGYEALSYNWGWHSYLCNGLEKELHAHCNTTLNPHGLIPDLKAAEDFIAYINTGIEAEPGLWLPYALIESRQQQLYSEEAMDVPTNATNCLESIP